MLKKSLKISPEKKAPDTGEKPPPSHLLLKVALAHLVLLYLFWTVGQWAVGRL